MKHPNPDQLKPLLNAVDTAVWAWAVKANTKKGQSCRVDWKNAIQELSEAYHMYQLAMSDKVAVLSASIADKSK
jgi:hypothetical protein